MITNILLIPGKKRSLFKFVNNLLEIKCEIVWSKQGERATADIVDQWHDVRKIFDQIPGPQEAHCTNMECYKQQRVISPCRKRIPNNLLNLRHSLSWLWLWQLVSRGNKSTGIIKVEVTGIGH